MAYKSLFLSTALTLLIGYAFTFGLTDPASPLKRLSDWGSAVLLAGVFLGYLLAFWWAFKGFGAHKPAALLSMGFCILALGCYAAFFAMEWGNGRASPGQYDYDFSKLAPSERTILAQLAQSAGLGLQDAVCTEHWRLKDASPGFRVCVQKGHLTALNFSNHPVSNLALLSQLPKLGDLYLNNCGLSDMGALQSTKLDRLELADNRITDLKTLAGCPKLRWLVLKNNQLRSIEGLEQFKELVSKDLSGNPILGNEQMGL